jgi:hypothetical protein
MRKEEKYYKNLREVADDKMKNIFTETIWVHTRKREEIMNKQSIKSVKYKGILD